MQIHLYSLCKLRYACYRLSLLYRISFGEYVLAVFLQEASVKQNSQLTTEPVMHKRTAILQVEAVTTNDSGSYRCEAKNSKGISNEMVWVDVFSKATYN